MEEKTYQSSDGCFFTSYTEVYAVNVRSCILVEIPIKYLYILYIYNVVNVYSV